ncbi:hypothetical protein GIB67_020664 [Kingdonia uniflora]|uniref:DUF4283 domain-containing protein n=1 Tax=Kingdonia uniflora TaxID=39325 RepID=A0A7J7M9I2_9MAGN|nr:hypothetical protein GIB67_020664 [Kingdonia uniflora]
MPIRLMPWSPLLSAENHQNMNVLIWYKFRGLSSELWSLKIVMSLRKTLGILIHIDRSTINPDYGYLASVLVDIDQSKPILTHVFIDVEGKLINQEILLYRVPKFCNHCKNMGYSIAEYKVVKMDLWEMEVASKVKVLFKEKNPTFADLLKHKPIDLGILPLPTMSGDFPSIRIPEARFLRGVERYKYSLNGRVDLLKVKLAVARSEALRKWNLSCNCQFIPLGKGYFIILLDNEADKMRIWGGGPWDIDGRGIANKDTFLQLKDLDKKHSPDLLCTTEPKVLPDEFFLNRLNLKTMVGEAIYFDNGVSCPNIWVLWRKELARPVILASSKQHITILFENMMVSCIHADYSYVRQRELW